MTQKESLKPSNSRNIFGNVNLGQSVVSIKTNVFFANVIKNQSN